MTDSFLRSHDFIVTGASGNVGLRLIPLLVREGRTVLAVGRDTGTLRLLFRDHVDGVTVTDYDGLGRSTACDTMVHLAVRNNDEAGSLADFIAVNVDFAAHMAREFTRMNGRRFLNMSSILSLDGGDESPYAVSKAMGSKRLREEIGERLDDVHIGYFHDEGYFGEKLAILRRFGSTFGSALFAPIKILKPTTSARNLADYVLRPSDSLPPPTILTDDISRSLLYRTVTRTMDLGVAIAILLFLFPVFVALWVAIRLDSPGPAIFVQERVGAARGPFKLYKFRTMKRDTVSAGTHQVSASAVTRIGAFLRRTKLDELPQAFNLLRGDMTLVGPRPCLFSQTELVNARQARGVYALKPGITGYAQIRGIDMSEPERLAQNDYIYAKLRSLLLDIRIILATALGRGAGDRVAAPDEA